MNDIMDEFKKLQKLAEKQKSDIARLQGQLSMVKEEFKSLGVSNIKDARSQIKSLQAKIEENRSTFNKLVATFKRRYAKHL